MQLTPSLQLRTQHVSPQELSISWTFFGITPTTAVSAAGMRSLYLCVHSSLAVCFTRWPITAEIPHSYLPQRNVLGDRHQATCCSIQTERGQQVLKGASVLSLFPLSGPGSSDLWSVKCRSNAMNQMVRRDVGFSATYRKPAPDQ